MQLALQQGFAQAQGGTWTAQPSRFSVVGELQAAGPWHQQSIWSGLVERSAPVPMIDVLAYRQNFGLLTGGFLRDVLDDAEWVPLARLYDPASPDDMFRRPDGHFVRGFMFTVGTKSDQHCGHLPILSSGAEH